jgi:hypothetical protein
MRSQTPEANYKLILYESGLYVLYFMGFSYSAVGPTLYIVSPACAIRTEIPFLVM